MKKMSVFLVVGLCLLLFTGCANKPVSPVSTYKFTIDGVLVKDMASGYDVAWFRVLKDSLAYDSAIITVDSDTVPNFIGHNYMNFDVVLKPESTYTVKVSCPNYDFSLTKYIIIPDTFHISIIDPVVNRGGQQTTISWTASQYASGYFVIVSPPSPEAVGHSALVNSSPETVDPPAFRTTSQDRVIYGTYLVYVVSYRESYLLYNYLFSIPDSLPTGNLNGANGTIGAGVIAPEGFIVVTTL
ncbi:MAG TPA: hypothetical protein VGB16_04280 [candidate division Zixibacteria bacterium]